MTSTDWVIFQTWRMIQQRSSFSLFWGGGWGGDGGLGIAGISSEGRNIQSLMLSILHFLCQHGITHPPRCPEGWFWRGSRGTWHAQTMLVSIPWQLPEGVPVSPQGKVYLAPAPFSTLGRRRQGLSLGSWSVAKAHNNEIILSLILGPLFVKKKKRGRERSRKNAFVDILLCCIFYFLYPLQFQGVSIFSIALTSVCLRSASSLGIILVTARR